MALTLAFTDWAMHLAAAPGKQTELARKAARTALQNASSIAGLILTTECMIAREPDKEATAGGGEMPA